MEEGLGGAIGEVPDHRCHVSHDSLRLNRRRFGRSRQPSEERLKRHITDAKYDILKWGVAGLAVILAAVYVVS